MKKCPSSFEKQVQVKSTYDRQMEKVNKPGGENKAVLFFLLFLFLLLLPSIRDVVGAGVYPVSVQRTP